MPATFNSGTTQQSSPAFTTKDFQLFFDDPESDSQESSPSFSSSSSSASTLQTIPSPPTFYLPTSSLPTEASSSFSGSLFPLDTSFMLEKSQIQQQSNPKKRANSEMEELQESESWNVNQSLSPSGWTSLRAPTIVFSAGQNSNQEATSIEQWLLQQQSNQSSQSHNQSHQHHHAQPHAQSQLQLAGYPNSNRGNEAINGNTSNYSHTNHLDRVYDGIGNNSAVRSGAINSNVGNFGLMSRRNGAQSTSYARTPETSCASHLQIQHPNSYYTSSNNSNQAAFMASTSNGTSSLVPRSEMSNQPNNDTSNQSSSSSNDSPFVDPRILFFTPRNQLDSGSSSFRDQQPPPHVQYQYQAQSQGGQSYIPNTYQFQYQSSNTYSSLNQSQYSNSRYTNQSSSSQSYHPSPSTSPTSSVLPPNRSLESGMVASYSQPPYEEPLTRPFSWEPQKSQQVKKEDPEIKSPSPQLEPNSRASTSRPQSSSSKATIVLRGPKGTQHADLPYDLSPQDLNPKPPASDFATKDVNKRPIDQSDKIRHTMDRYTPKYVRGSGAAREGFCSLCPGDGKWLRLKSSAYNFHLLYAHGIDSISGLRFPAPTELRYVYTSSNSEPQTQNDTDDPDSDPHSRNTEGKCPNCKEWIHLTSGKRKPSFALFYKHMHAHGEVRKEFPPFSPEIESKDSDYSDEERGAKGKRRRTR